MNRIKKLRQDADLKQTDLAKILSVSQAALSGYETGKYEPDFVTLQKIADYFEVSIDYVLGRDIKKDAPGLTKKDEAPHPQNGVVVYKDGRAVARKFPRLAVEDIDRLLELMHKQMGAVDDEDQP